MLLIIYLVLGFWATGKTIYANKIVFCSGGYFFFKRAFWGMLFGWILIPIALIKVLMGR